MHVRIMMDDVYIYHAHTIFPLSLFCVGTHVYSSTSQSQELTKRALESNDDLGSRELSFPPLSSRIDYAHLSHLDLTWLWAIYHFSLLAHFTVFTLHAMLASMPLPCNCDPCLHLPMIHHYATPMCICMLGGDPCCYCHVYHVPHAIDACCVGRVMMFHCYLHMASRQYIDDIFLISCFHACDMSCALFMPTICTHDMLAMIPSSMLHLRTTSLLDLITMITCLVA